MAFLTEPETAERLRCSTSKIKRLRLSGALPYVPGRPVLIDENDLNAYLECLKCRPQNSPKTATDTSTPSGRTMGDPDARAWARKTVLLRKAGSRSGF